MKLLSGIQEIFVSLLLPLTQASFILVLFVSPSQQDSTRDGNMTKNLIGLILSKTNPETLRTWLCHTSQDKDLTVKLRTSTPEELRKRVIVLRQMGFCAHCNTVFEAMGCFYHYCPFQKSRPSLTEKDIKRGNKKRNGPDEKALNQREKFIVVEMWECERWNL